MLLCSPNPSRLVCMYIAIFFKELKLCAKVKMIASIPRVARLMCILDLISVRVACIENLILNSVRL